MLNMRLYIIIAFVFLFSCSLAELTVTPAPGQNVLTVEITTDSDGTVLNVVTGGTAPGADVPCNNTNALQQCTTGVCEDSGLCKRVAFAMVLDSHGGKEREIQQKNSLPLLEMDKYSNGHAFELYNADYAYCSSPLNAPTVNLWSGGWKGFWWLLALLYCFLGVSIVADLFMAAIEVITSSEKKVTRIVENPETGDDIQVTIRVRTWNDTVANLTLLALGSSAPEIILAVLEVIPSLENMEAGELGASTIVGSAAFNLFMISAVCCISVPDANPDIGETGERRLAQIGVFLITAFSSVFAYVWMVIVIVVTSPEELELWEAVVTFMMFPLLVGVAYAQDVDLFCTKSDKAANPKISIGLESQVKSAVDSVDMDDPNEVAKATARLKREMLKNKSPLFWRINGARILAGKKMLVRPGDTIEPEFKKETEMGVISDKQKNQISQRKRTRAMSNCGFKTTIQFHVPQFTVFEDEGQLSVKVFREGDVSRQHMVDYETIDGTAEHDNDFEYVQGTLVFSPGESFKEITVKIYKDEEVEENEFFSLLLTNPQGGSCTIGEMKMTTIIIIDVSDPGELRFREKAAQCTEGCGVVKIPVDRVNGSTGEVTVDYSTRPGSAHENVDFRMKKGTLVFAPNEVTRFIEIEIIDNKEIDQRNRDFYILLSNAEPAGKAHIMADYKRINIGITDDDDYAAVVSQVLENVQALDDLGAHTWKNQYKEALDYDETNDSLVSMVLHTFAFPWKALFAAIVPPTSYGGGYATFAVSLACIGGVTYIVGDLAKMWGCMIGINEAFVAVTIVALGTSMPDTFASKTATIMSPYADSAIGNITGSNSVNVFLGMGLPWLICAIAGEIKQETYKVPKGSLALSVTVFIPLAIICLSTFIVREYMGIGAMGGTKCGRKIMAIVFASEWFIFLFFAYMSSKTNDPWTI